MALTTLRGQLASDGFIGNLTGTVTHPVRSVSGTVTVATTDAILIADATAATGGRLLGVYSVGPSGRATIDLSLLDNVLVAGDQLVISGQVTSGAASEMSVSLSWDEVS